MASRAELLARVRAKQQVGSTPAKPLRIILEFEQPRAPDAIATAINERLQIRVEAARLCALQRELTQTGRAICGRR